MRLAQTTVRKADLHPSFYLYLYIYKIFYVLTRVAMATDMRRRCASLVIVILLASLADCCDVDVILMPLSFICFAQLLSQRVGTTRSSAAHHYALKTDRKLWEHLQKFTVPNLEEGVARLR